LQIAENADVFTAFGRDLAHHLNTALVFGGQAMRKIDSDHVGAGGDHAGQDFRIVRSRSECRNDLSSSHDSRIEAPDDYPTLTC
jgi:hypothetical protein